MMANENAGNGAGQEEACGAQRVARQGYENGAGGRGPLLLSGYSGGGAVLSVCGWHRTGEEQGCSPPDRTGWWSGAARWRAACGIACFIACRAVRWADGYSWASSRRWSCRARGLRTSTCVVTDTLASWCAARLAWHGARRAARRKGGSRIARSDGLAAAAGGNRGDRAVARSRGEAAGPHWCARGRRWSAYRRAAQGCAVAPAEGARVERAQSGRGF